MQNTVQLFPVVVLLERDNITYSDQKRVTEKTTKRDCFTRKLYRAIINGI